MCMNKPASETMELATTTTTPHDLEKQQPLQPHSPQQEKQQSARVPSLYKVLISLNLFSILVLLVIYYVIEMHPNFYTNLNELFHRMEKCNDL
ncbi:hypothetical protein Cantr_00139 [Candida viswanathii]|uniref:Uncharacterized protein n=1 Tax=Candida viswanathii TaxID=5486 RepID=A0A367YID7_9ASCO|nr:hypothetical protein Cantr_00137 [Candida viswanathii]RCK64742.1 hypothetical protein Cantr_00139 [Candida viswanathii]